MDGNLNDEVGRILTPEVKKLVAAFKAGGDRQKLVNEMKAIDGADLYVRVMERIIANGYTTIESDVKKMSDVVKQRKGSNVSIDGVKRRLNVFREFLPENSEL
jgi:N-methylhydantoinase B/oxoprolinase/acetone carboxylase alpha subunit